MRKNEIAPEFQPARRFSFDKTLISKRELDKEFCPEIYSQIS